MTEEYVPVRLSHLLRDCSVGAIVRGPDSLMVVQDVRTWDRLGSDPMEREIRYVDRVRSSLGIERALCAPPRAVERGETIIGWIPALRFPTWARCLNPKCGLMHHAPWRRSRPSSGDDHRRAEAQGAGGAGECSGCGGRLEQTPWVLVHEDGYLADVPWHALAHGDARNPEQRQCRADRTQPYLKLDEVGTGRIVRCTRCKSEANLPSGALPRIPFPPHTWRQPWVREPPAQAPEIPALLLEINDVRVHSAKVRTALVIPPESRIRRGTVIDHLYASTKSQLGIRKARNPLARKGAVRQLAREYRCTPREIEEAIAGIDSGYPLGGRTFTAGDLLADEYRALIEEIPDLGEDEDFVTEHHTRCWKALGRTLDAGVARRAVDAVSRLTAVNRLKEIMVLEGFQRAGGKSLTPPDITGEGHWLPALELYGEGIFFTLDEALLQRWEDGGALQKRADAFSRRYVQRAGQGVPEFEVEVSPRFLLCHTLAHLLIRELDAEAGYPAASLKERIYCATGREPMAGILIYVAVADEEGSLGGLMELAKPDRFLRLLTGAFEAAAWCSLDPVCSEQEGHGPDLLNRAACHACALVPETSCPYGNVLLDRGFVKGAAPDVPAFLNATAPDAAGEFA